MESALVDRAVAEETEAAALAFQIFQAIRQSKTERGLVVMMPWPPQKSCRERKKCIDPPLPFEQPVCFPGKLRHTFVHRHANSQGVGVAAVGGDVVVMLSTERKRSYRHGFLANVEVEELPMRPGFWVVRQRHLLEAADRHHLRVADFPLRGERLVDGRIGEVQIGHFDGEILRVGRRGAVLRQDLSDGDRLRG